MSVFPQVLPQPRFPDPKDAPSLRWGVLAPGHIASAFVDALIQHSTQRVVAVGSRSAERAEAFAAEHGIERAYGSYERLVADPEIDVVYIASPHSGHTEHALLAIAAGKSILVEKPMAATEAEARIIVDAARAAGVFAMEAMWTRHLPHSDVARQLLEDGALGEVRIVAADFGFAADYDPAGRLFNPALAGGALLDLGVYPVAWASFAMGTPHSVTATGILAPTGVDAQASLLLTGENAQALLSVSLLAGTPSAASIWGTDARIEVEPKFWAPSDLSLVSADGERLFWRDQSGITASGGMSYEAAALARYLAEGQTESPLNPLDETLSVLHTIDEARRQIGYTSLDLPTADRA